MNRLMTMTAALTSLTLMACGGEPMEGAAAERTDGLVVNVTNLSAHEVEALQVLMERYAAGELMAIEGRDVCGGLPCPQPAPLVDLPQDPVPLHAPVSASAMNDLPEDPCGVGPRPIGPVPQPAALEVAEQLAR